MPIEVRYDERQKVDEIVASDCTAHLERMDKDAWCLIIETASSRSNFSIRKRAKTLVETTVVEIDMSGGRPSPLQQKLEDLENVRAAYEFVLPYLHVDIRAQALAIYDPKPTPLEKHIGELGSRDQPGAERG